MREERKRRPRRLLQPFDWALTSPARGLRMDIQDLVLFPILRLFARVKLEGDENLKGADGPVVIVSNHTSHFDCPVILASLPRRIRNRTIVAAASDYFYKVGALGALTSLALATVPFSRQEGSRDSLETLKEGIRRGWSVLIFPEGTRSATGQMGEFKKGAAFLCVDAKCAALPIFLKGSYEIMPKGSTFPKPGKVLVRFGPHVAPRPDDDYDSFTTRIEDAVVALGAGQ